MGTDGRCCHNGFHHKFGARENRPLPIQHLWRIRKVKDKERSAIPVLIDFNFKPLQLIARRGLFLENALQPLRTKATAQIARKLVAETTVPKLERKRLPTLDSAYVG